jgi:hypothetical protein
LSVNHDPYADTDFTKKELTGIDCETAPAPNLGRIVDDKVYADVNGDGFTDAIVSVACQGSTESWPDYLEVFDGASGKLIATLIQPEHAHDYFGLRIGYGALHGITVSGKEITVESAAWSPSDSYPCPSWTVTDHYTWNGKSFDRSPRVTKKAPAGTCAGDVTQEVEQGAITLTSPDNGMTPTHVEQKLLTGQILVFYTTNLLGLLSTSEPATENMYSGVINQTTITPVIGHVTNSECDFYFNYAYKGTFVYKIVTNEKDAQDLLTYWQQKYNLAPELDNLEHGCAN